MVQNLGLANLGVLNSTREMAGTAAAGLPLPVRSLSTHNTGQAHLHCRHSLVAATWNILSLVERAGGDQRICQSRPQPQVCEGSTAVNCKLDLLVSELKWYFVSVAAIQETNWFREGRVGGTRIHIPPFWASIACNGWSCSKK